MTIVKTDQVRIDDAEKTILYDVDDLLGPVNQQIDWKPGSTGDNQTQLETKLQQALTYFGGNYQSWDSMTAAQKDAAAKQAQRALANIARFLLGQFDSAGP